MSQPRSNPSTRPGVKLSTRSTAPGARASQRRRELVAGVLESEQQQQQDHAELRTALDEATGGDELEHTAFAEHQAGQQVERYRRDAEPGTQGDRRPPARSGSRRVRGAVSQRQEWKRGSRSRGSEESGSGIDSFRGADHDRGVVRREPLLRPWAPERPVAAHQRNDRHPGTRSKLRFTDGPTGYRTRGRDRQPVDGEPVDVASEFVEPLADRRTAEEVGEIAGLTSVHRDRCTDPIGIFTVEDHHVASIAVMEITPIRSPHSASKSCRTPTPEAWFLGSRS